MSILDEYQKQVQHDRIDETYECENMAPMTDEEYEEYKNAIDDLREQMYENIPKEMSSRVENKSYPKSVLKAEPQTEYQTMENAINLDAKIDTFKILPQDGIKFTDIELNTVSEPFIPQPNGAVIKRAYCPYCGEEIVTKNPTMYNPFNYEPVCIYKCPKCEHEYQVDGSYPRLIIKDPKNNDVKLHIN